MGDESPLSRPILVEQFPLKFKLPMPNKYNRTRRYIGLENKQQALKEERKFRQNNENKQNEKNHSSDRAYYFSRNKEQNRIRFHNYTPLNEPRSQLLMWIQKNGE